MSEKPRPETSLDLQGYFCEILNMKPDQVEKYFEFIAWSKAIGARFKKYLPHGFKDLAAAVEGWGGNYDRDRRQFVIPKSNVNNITKPAPSHPQKTTEVPPIPVKPGYYEKFPINLILSPKFSFRLNIEDTINELVEQIGTTRVSEEWCYIAEPLFCRPAKKSGYIELGAGNRRLLAAKRLGLGVVPVVVKECSDEEFDRIRLMENLARADLRDYETARALKYLIDKYPETYPTQSHLAEVFGKTQAWVSFHLRMLELAEDENITRVIKPEQLTEGQARAILEAPEEKRPEVAKHIKEHIEKEGILPSMREIKKFVQPEATSEITPEPATGPIPLQPTAMHCENCNVQTFDPKDFHGHTLCPVCYEEAERDPEKFAAKIKGPKKPERAAGETKAKPQPLLTGFEIECPQCGLKLLINHREFPDGSFDHKIKELPV